VVMIYRYQSRQTNTVVMFFQYYICKFPLFSTKYMYMINKFKYHQFLYLCSVLYLHLITFTMSIPLLLVHESIIHPVVSASALTWFIRHIYYWNLQFLNNVYIIIFPGITHFWQSHLCLLVFFLSITFKLFGLPIIWGAVVVVIVC
jgi:hypothetical protein